jgi:hypothetical protein
MYIRNHTGSLIFIDVSKFSNEGEFYKFLWKQKYNIKIDNSTPPTERILNYIMHNIII